MNAQAYKITCLTNLHAGTGAADQGIIDNLVQRDHVDRIPCIYASSLKGALREYFEEVLCKKNETDEEAGDKTEGNEQKQPHEQDPVGLSKEDVTGIFGSGSKEETKQKGSYIFYDALLLSVPARSNINTFYQVTSWRCLERIFEMNKMLGIEGTEHEPVGFPGEEDRKKKFYLSEKVQKDREKQAQQLELEFWKYPENDSVDNELKLLETSEMETHLKKLIGEDGYIILGDDDFDILVSDYFLPVIARNQLENGISQNLFYEQVMPRQSRFVFWTDRFPEQRSKNDTSAGESNDSFKNGIAEAKRPVQIGANASIGYGYCKIKHLNFSGREQ